MRFRSSYLLLSALLLTAQANASAPLIGGLGGAAGYGQLTQGPNDDQSSGEILLPFSLNFFGTTYNSLFVNNNGNVTFGSQLSSYTPSPFPASTVPMIAPWWGDVDTRNQPGGGAVYFGSPDSSTAVVTWNDVGFYSADNSRLNNFQLVLRDRADTGTGNFDVEFRYNRLEWTTGDASGGQDGLGGIPAQAGYDAGDGANFFTLPGSRTSAVLDLINTSNLSFAQPGQWLLPIRNGTVADGSTPGSALMPTITTEDGFNFDFFVEMDDPIFIDPFYAIGYDYVVNEGANIASALFPTVAGDVDGYQLFGFNDATGAYDIALGSVLPGETFNFGTGGLSRFRLADIDIEAEINPDNPRAFITGLTFVESGRVLIDQNPITQFVNVPEPDTWALMIAGFGMAGAGMRRRKARVAAYH